VVTVEGVPVTEALVRTIIEEETARLREELGEATYTAGRFEEARSLFEAVALADEFPEFLTLPGYEILEEDER
jgi:malate synthase